MAEEVNVHVNADGLIEIEETWDGKEASKDVSNVPGIQYIDHNAPLQKSVSKVSVSADKAN